MAVEAGVSRWGAMLAPLARARGLVASAVCGVLLATLSACTSPRERLYTLQGPASAGVEASEGVAGGPVHRATVFLGPVSIPAEVDRPQLVERGGSYHDTLTEQDRWAVPLREALPRLLADELTRKSPERRFVPPSSGAIATPSARLAVDIQRFEGSRGDGVVVRAHWVYRSTVVPDSVPVEGDAEAHAAISGSGYEGFVDALRRATTEVADRIATALPAGS